MAITVTAGLSRKHGLPDYGSVGACCNVEFEADAGLLEHDLDGFQQRVRDAYTACNQAINDELARHQQNGPEDTGNPAEASHLVPSDGGNNGVYRNGTNGHRATDKQLSYTRQLAGQINGLGIRRLDTIAQKMFSKPLADLSSLECSGLIDCLKGIKSGSITLADALSGVPA